MTEVEVSVKNVVEGSEKTLELSGGVRIENLLEKMSENPETVVTKRNGMIVTEEEELSDGDDVEIISIVSGG